MLGSKSKLSRIWQENDEENDQLTVNGFYGNNLKDFMGRHFQVATNPWSHHVQAPALPADIGRVIEFLFSMDEYVEFDISIACYLFYNLQNSFTATPRFKYTDYWGYEVNILEEIARVINFTYTIENPPDGKSK